MPRKSVLAAEPDNVLNDQQFIHDKGELLFSDCFAPIGVGSGSGWTDIATIVVVHDMCGTDATLTCDFSIKAWATGFENFDIALYHVGDTTRYVTNVTLSQTSEIWRDYTNITLDTDGTENVLKLQVSTGDSYGALIGGVCIFSDT